MALLGPLKVELDQLSRALKCGKLCNLLWQVMVCPLFVILTVLLGGLVRHDLHP